MITQSEMRHESWTVEKRSEQTAEALLELRDTVFAFATQVVLDETPLTGSDVGELDDLLIDVIDALGSTGRLVAEAWYRIYDHET